MSSDGNLRCEGFKVAWIHSCLTIVREAHRMVPASWTFRRQARSLEKVGDGPFARFWQGPTPDAPGLRPYAGDWLTDVCQSGAENYYEPWRP